MEKLLIPVGSIIELQEQDGITSWYGGKIRAGDTARVVGPGTYHDCVKLDFGKRGRHSFNVSWCKVIKSPPLPHDPAKRPRRKLALKGDT